jgi:hypothetical protein
MLVCQLLWLKATSSHPSRRRSTKRLQLQGSAGHTYKNYQGYVRKYGKASVLQQLRCHCFCAAQDLSARTIKAKKRNAPWPERPPRVGEVSAKLADRGCLMVIVTDTYDRILGFLDRIRYSFIQAAP